MKTYCIQQSSETSHTELSAWLRALEAIPVSTGQVVERLRNQAGLSQTGEADLLWLEGPVVDRGLLGALKTPRARATQGGEVMVVVRASIRDPELELPAWAETLRSADLVLVERWNVATAMEQQIGLTPRVLVGPSQRRLGPAGTQRVGRDFTVVAPPGYGHRQFVRDVGWVAYWVARLRKRLRFVSIALAESHPGRVAESSAIVYLPCALEDGGNLAESCAHFQALLIAEADYAAAGLTHPHTTFRGGDRERVLRLVLWLLSDQDTRQFLRTVALHGVRNLHQENRRLQLARQLQYALPKRSAEIVVGEANCLLSEIHHCSGPELVPAQRTGCIAVCLQRNGAEYVEAFLNHHRVLGVEHFVVVDNESTDDSFERLKAQPDVTMYRTSLPHKHYECEIRRLILEKHGRHRWCLNVDIDELFDFPHSKRLGVSGLIAYLRGIGATAMVAYLLDMFAKRTEFTQAGWGDPRSQCAFFDLSNVEKRDYHGADVVGYCGHNVLADPGIQNYYGGIRQTVFGSKTGARYLLTKHPLLFLDGLLNPVTTPHYCDRAKVGDVTGVLYHYKFTPSFRQKVLESRKAGRYAKFAQDQYDNYGRRLSASSALAIETPDAQRLTDIEQLLDSQFIRSSPSYDAFALSRRRTARSVA